MRRYIRAMSQPPSDLIPPSPSREAYARAYAEAHEANADDAFYGTSDPFPLFARWLRDAGHAEPNDPNAMTLATVDEAGLPDARMVLLKDLDARGFTFYSNLASAKGRQIAMAPRAALVFHWKSLRRQVRVRGALEPVSDTEADAYFATRARESRIGAWASDQSRPLEDRATLEARLADETRRFEGLEVSRPDHWSGWRLVPVQIEFWRDRPFRLHDRLQFTRGNEGEGWARALLYP